MLNSMTLLPLQPRPLVNLSIGFCPRFVAANFRHVLPNGVEKYAPGIKEMDSTEENYFNEEEEEIPVELIPSEEPGPEQIVDLKRGRQDDDADDELLHLAQKSPKVNGKKNFRVPLTIDHGSNGASSSPTSSPSDKTPTSKRPRDDDEQEDELERLGRSSKRVISPTDVKRKSSRSLNGRGKIALPLGKK
jgi:hypothetical protein